MMALRIEMTARPGKSKELHQTALEWIRRARKRKGSAGCHFSADTERTNSFVLDLAWEKERDLMDHIGSDEFGVLLGALNVLCVPTDCKIRVFSETEQAKRIEKALRGRIENRPAG